MNRKNEYIQLILLIIPYSALILKYFLATQQTIPQQQLTILTMHDQFAIQLSTFNKPQNKIIQVNNFLSSEIFYCDQLILTNIIKNQLISNDFSIQLEKNQYHFFSVDHDKSIPTTVNCSNIQGYDFDINNTTICRIDELSVKSYKVQYYQYDVSQCSNKYINQKYLVGKPINQRVDVSGFKVSIRIFSGASNEIYILLSMIIFVISLTVLVYYSFIKKLKKKSKFVYLTDENNQIEMLIEQ